MATFEQLKDEYTRLLDELEVRENWKARIDSKARRIISNRARYEEVSKVVGVPWEMIGAIHDLEGNCDFSTHLHNGDTLQRRTYHVPRGYPKTGNPPFTWVESAIDALRLKGLQNVKDWSDERVCYEMERYNGFGYRNYHPNVLSPYLWSGTNHYVRGKYVRDGQWSSSHVSQQVGAVPIYLRVKELTKPLTRSVKKELVASSSKLSFISGVKNAVKVTIATVLGFDYMGFLDQVKQVASDNKVLTILLVGGVTYAVVKIIEKLIYKDYTEGRWTPSGMADQPKEEEDVQS